LVELTAGLLVAAMVIALVSTGAARMMDQANTVRCVGNLRSIGIGTLAWTADRNGMLWSREELGYSRYRMVDDPKGPPELLKDYLPDKRVWLCPAGRSSLKIFGNNYTWLPSPRYDTIPIHALSQTASKTVIYYDAFIYSLPSMFNASDDVRGTGTIGPQALRSQFHRRPHDGLSKSNWLYLDGHIETR